MDYKSVNFRAFSDGMRDGLPIGLGYLAVSFSLGIAARDAGLSWFQAALASLLCNASAGEYAGFTLIGAAATYIEVAVMTLVANARYLLMSCAMSQRMSPSTGLLHRIIMAFDITDEVFAVSIARSGYLNPYYTYGAMVASMPFWASGTALGVVAGALLAPRIVSALSVALYGMFIAVIVPPARKNPVVAVIIAVCFVLSFAVSRLPALQSVPSGTVTIVLTVAVSAVAAILFPRREEGEQ